MPSGSWGSSDPWRAGPRTAWGLEGRTGTLGVAGRPLPACHSASFGALWDREVVGHSWHAPGLHMLAPSMQSLMCWSSSEARQPKQPYQASDLHGADSTLLLRLHKKVNILMNSTLLPAAWSAHVLGMHLEDWQGCSNIRVGAHPWTGMTLIKGRA